MRRQEASEMAEDDDDHAIMEEVRSEPQLGRAQHLRGVALPRVGLAVEPDQAADQEDDEADIRVDAEEQQVDIVEERHRDVSALKWLMSRRVGRERVLRTPAART